jgi:hypothetical protein
MTATGRLPILALLAAAAVLLGPAAAAADGAVAQVAGSRLASPQASVSAVLAALADVNGTGSLFLDADRVEVTVEEETSPTYLDQVPPGGYQASPPRRERHADVQDAHAVLREGHSAYVLPLAGEPAPLVQRDAGCAALVPSTRQSIDFFPPMHTGAARSRHPTAVETGPTLQWDGAACPEPTWTLAGSFQVELFEADLALGDTVYTSGLHEQGSGPGPVGPAPSVNATGERTYRFLFLTVHGGRLVMHGAPSLFLAAADLRASHLAVDDATGSAPTLADGPLTGDRVELAGDLGAHATRASGAGAGPGLDVRVTGHLDSGSVGGRAFAVASGGGPDPGLWLAALIAVPVVASGGAAAAWRADPARRLARLELGLAGTDAGAPATVAARSRRLQRHADLHSEATALRVEALAAAGRTAEALAEAGHLPGWEGALATAYVHARAGQADAAVEALRPWQAAEPLQLRFALRQPAFAALLAHPEAALWARPAAAAGEQGAAA